MDVRTEPTIPLSGNPSHPQIDVYGRAGDRIGSLVWGYCRIDGVYSYSFRTDHCDITELTLTQIAEKIHVANKAAKEGWF